MRRNDERVGRVIGCHDELCSSEEFTETGEISHPDHGTLLKLLKSLNIKVSSGDSVHLVWTRVMLKMVWSLWRPISMRNIILLWRISGMA